MNAYRKRYDTHYAQIIPHITIKSDDNELESLKNDVKNRISDIEPVEVHATKASNFAPTTNVIYFKVAKTESLERLFDQFNNDDFFGTAEHTFVLHFTIAQGLTSQEFEDIYGQVKLAGIDHKETIGELSLLQYNEDEDKWLVIETFKLG